MPDLGAQLAAIGALVAELTAMVATVQAQLQIVVNFQTLLATGGVHALVLSGPVNQLGTDLSGALSAGLPGGGPLDSGNALVLATTVGAAWSAISTMFKVTP